MSRYGGEYDGVMERRPAEPQTATPGLFCTPCTAAGKVGVRAHRTIVKGGKPFGMCSKCFQASLAPPAAPRLGSFQDEDEELGDAMRRRTPASASTAAPEEPKADEPEELPEEELREGEDDPLEDDAIAPPPKRKKREGRGMPHANQIEVDSVALAKDFRAGMKMRELVVKYGMAAPTIYGRLKRAGVTRANPASLARFQNQAKPSPRALARPASIVKAKGGRALAAAEPATLAPSTSTGNDSAHVRFRVVECEASADSGALTEAIRAFTQALSKS